MQAMRLCEILAAHCPHQHRQKTIREKGHYQNWR